MYIQGVLPCMYHLYDGIPLYVAMQCVTLMFVSDRVREACLNILMLGILVSLLVILMFLQVWV